MPRKISRKLCRSRQRNLQLIFRVETGARPNVQWNGGGEGHEQVGGGNRREYRKVIGRLGLTWAGSTPVAPLHESTQRFVLGAFWRGDLARTPGRVAGRGDTVGVDEGL